MTSTLWKNLFGQVDNPDDLRYPSSLSDDACGNLVHSLVSFGYLTKVATSLDGKSFITDDQLRIDILAQLESRNGRVSLLELPKALNANMADIQDRVQELLRSHTGKLVQVQDELLQIEYLEQTTNQLKMELSTQGYLIVADASRKYKFNIEYMRQFLKDRVGSSIPGQWDTADRGLAIAPWFLEQEKATLLKYLNELQEPTSLPTLRSKRVVQEQLIYGLCDLLSKDNKLAGVFKGAGDQSIFIPRPYEQQQTEWIELFFRNNGFIEFDALKKHGVTDPKTYIHTNHPTALLLETHAVKESIWSIIDASVEDTISNLSWIDAKPLLPSPLTKEDISSLVRQLPSLAEPTSCIAVAPDQDPSLTGLRGGAPQEAFVIQDSIVVTSGQMQKCLLKMGPLLDRKVKALISWRLTFGDNDELLEGYDDMDDQGSTLKMLMENLSTSKHNGSRAKNTQSNKGMELKKKKRLQEFLTIQDVKEEILHLEPDFDPALVNTIAGALYRDLLRNLKDRNRSVILNQVQEEDEDENTTVMRENDIISEIQSLSKRIMLFSKGIDVFEDATVRNSLSKYHLQSLCVELLDLTALHLTTSIKESDNSGNPPSAAAKDTRKHLQRLYAERHIETETIAGRQGPFVISQEDASLLSEFIPKGTVDSLKRLRKLTAGSGKQKNLVEYLDVWSSIAKSLAHDMDTGNAVSKDDRHFISEHMKELHKALVGIKPQSDAALMLHIVTLIAFQSWSGCMLHASGKYVPRILRQLRLLLEQQSSTTCSVENTRNEGATSQLDLLERMLNSVLSNVKQQETDQGTEPDSQQLWQSVFDLGVLLSTP
ncbi:E3 UFM1-protein ligase 1 [Mortierella polycephala]|uniref:E3 UFM1-protein ligase 1 n=1 Tax=Mortierella polycephala TaxID=41804 RepID=A0A9P6U212_9FUNG|nr:E3 UFM1-protein ligase 1 [Mortierella polycephala]